MLEKTEKYIQNLLLNKREATKRLFLIFKESKIALHMKKIFLILFIGVTCWSCNSQKSDLEGVTIDPSIKAEAEKYLVEDSEYAQMGDIMQVYGNSAFLKLYDNDSLVFQNEDPARKLPFKSFYFWDKDTLGINGAYGLFGGTGFYIKIENKKATLYHMLSSDDSPSYAYKEKDDLIMRLEVPSTDTKIVLSELPNQTDKQIIYGYVEFKSGEYFATQGFADGKEILPRKRTRCDMRVYFKSGFLKIPR